MELSTSQFVPYDRQATMPYISSPLKTQFRTFFEQCATRCDPSVILFDEWIGNKWGEPRSLTY